MARSPSPSSEEQEVEFVIAWNSRMGIGIADPDSQYKHTRIPFRSRAPYKISNSAGKTLNTNH